MHVKAIRETARAAGLDADKDDLTGLFTPITLVEASVGTLDFIIPGILSRHRRHNIPTPAQNMCNVQRPSSHSYVTGGLLVTA
jgi:hypothetical protein